MFRCLAIADDLSGAAEIAGIGFRFGLPVRVLRSRDALAPATEGLTVADTDTRSVEEITAVYRMEPLLQTLRKQPADLIYKKTDSVLRGNVAQESAFVRGLFDRRRVILVAQNPSRERTISRDGVYRIAGVPLDQTDFARDPEHPARSADAWTLLREPWARCLGVVDALPDQGTVIGAADSLDDVAHWAARVDPATDLPAGSGDFFTALLAARGLRPDRPAATLDPGGRRLFLCGSASEPARALPKLAAAHGVAWCPMPDGVFAGAAPLDAWTREVVATMEQSSRALAFIPQPLDRPAAGRLQAAIADLAAGVLARTSVENLLLEGGATAAAVCGRMNWNAFEVTGELSPGVVRLRAGKQTLIIKPGSYPWPQSVWGPA
jgi:uncharacterized protein YgbK (DUF1537 family)